MTGRRHDQPMTYDLMRKGGAGGCATTRTPAPNPTLGGAVTQPTDPLVAKALTLLQKMYIEDRYTASTILRRWVHFGELSGAQIREILDRYPSRGHR